MSDLAEIKSLLDKQGEAFEAFKSANDTRIKELEKKGAADPVTAEKVEKIEKSLDAYVEAKAALEKKIEAERKEREELELRLTRPGAGGKDAIDPAKELKSFNDVLKSALPNRYQPLDQKGFDSYAASFKAYLREGFDGPSAVDKKTMSVGSDPDGGYFVTPDMSGRMVTKVYETSDFRPIASQQTIGTDALEGIEDLGEAGAGYAGEHSQGSDTTTPQIGKWRIPVFWIDTEPKTTQQLLDDANVDVEAWLAGKVADKFARFENNEFINGTLNIRGIVTYTNTADTGSVPWGQIGYIASGKAAAFASVAPADALFDMVGAVKRPYLGNSRWVTRRSVITAIRKFKGATTGDYLWQPGLQAGQPENLIGYPVTRAEDMPALASGSFSLGFGDFRAGYQIVDRAGIRVLRDNLTAKPYVKFYTTKRTGGGVVNFEAYKLMKFATS